MIDKSLELVKRGNEFYSIIKNIICTDEEGIINSIEDSMNSLINALLYNKQKGNSLYIIGNGGSAGIASHALTDFVNVCGLRAFTLHDSSLITCMANDFGYENAYARILGIVMRPGDHLIAISSSGKSLNICNAAKLVREKGGKVTTLSGFNADNQLRKLGNLNFWLDSCDYGYVEIGHSFILHNIADRIGHDLKMAKNLEMVASNLAL